LSLSRQSPFVSVCQTFMAAPNNKKGGPGVAGPARGITYVKPSLNRSYFFLGKVKSVAFSHIMAPWEAQ
jgi:hypothetical protein